METTIRLDNVICSYPKVLKKAVYQGKETGYECNFLIPKTPEGNALATSLFGIVSQLSADNNIKKPLSPDRYCIQDGDLMGKPDNMGYWHVKSSIRDTRPVLLNADRTPMQDSDVSQFFYGGSITTPLLRIYYTANHFGRFCAELLGLQFIAHGEPLGDVTRETPEDIMAQFDINPSVPSLGYAPAVAPIGGQFAPVPGMPVAPVTPVPVYVPPVAPVAPVAPVPVYVPPAPGMPAPVAVHVPPVPPVPPVPAFVAPVVSVPGMPVAPVAPLAAEIPDADVTY